jgi:hypothetical protein
MKSMSLFFTRGAAVMAALAAAVALTGCASTDGKATGQQPSRFKMDDGRTVDIGRASSASGGGTNYKSPHLDNVWVADGFNFSGYDTVYVAPTRSTAKFKNDEQRLHDLAAENLAIELSRMFASRKLFLNVVTRETDIKPGVPVLKVENTIVEYAKGGGAARYFAGLYGGGQPVLRVQGRMTDGDKTLFRFEARRSGVSAGARMGGAMMKDEDIQLEDIRSMVLDLTDFVEIIARKLPKKETP